MIRWKNVDNCLIAATNSRKIFSTSAIVDIYVSHESNLFIMYIHFKKKDKFRIKYNSIQFN